MGKHSRRRPFAALVGALVIAAVAVVGSGPAGSATGDPAFTGGQTVAPFVGNYEPAAASNGTSTLVVWEKRNGQGGLADIWGRITSTDTKTIKPAFRISQRPADEYAPDVAWSGSAWLVVWETAIRAGREEVRGRRVSKTGGLLGAELPIAVRNARQNEPAVGAGPNGQFLVAWEDSRNASTTLTDVYARRVAASGALLDGTGKRLSTDTSPSMFVQHDFEPDIAWNGRIYLTVWEGREPGRDVSGIDSGGLTSSGSFEYTGYLGGGALGSTRNYDATRPAVAVSGRFFQVVWQEEDAGQGGATNIVGVRTDATQGSQQSFPISKAAGNQTDPTIACNGQCMVVWSDERNGDEDLWGARLSANAVVQDLGGYLVTEHHATNRSPSLTKGSSTAKTFTIAWEATPTSSAGIVAFGIGPGVQ